MGNQYSRAISYSIIYFFYICTDVLPTYEVYVNNLSFYCTRSLMDSSSWTWVIFVIQQLFFKCNISNLCWKIPQMSGYNFTRLKKGNKFY